MQSTDKSSGYCVWGRDGITYGPLPLDTLKTWIRGHRISAESWVYSAREDRWQPAREWPELIATIVATKAGTDKNQPRARAAELLRGLPLLNGLSDEQIASFTYYAEIIEVEQFTRIARKDDPGDAMFVVLEGEVRAYVFVDGRECTLGCIGPGEFVGEISLLDEGPRSAELAANVETTLLKISNARLRALLDEAPALAAPFLLALSRTVVGRIRNMTRRYQDSIHYMGKSLGARV